MVSLLPLLFLAPGSAEATDSGTLIVRTLDTRGAAFPGVVVEILNSKGVSARASRQTDASGTASFLLPVGPGYTASVTVSGYSPQSSEEFKIELDRRKTIVFTMQERIVEKVEVKASKVVDLDEGGVNRVAFSHKFVEDLPILGRSYQSVLALAPGVNDSNNDGNPNVHGARERDFKATVDGVSNVDPLTGTFMSNINPDAIEEIEIVTTGAGVEYGGAVGGFGRIITKQGTNAFDGSTSIYVRSSFFDGNTIRTGTDSEKTDYHDVRPTLNFTGPLVKDKLFFALFHEYIDRGQPVNNIGGGGVVVIRKGSRNLDKLTWQVSPRNKLIFQTQSDPLRIGPLAVTSLTDPRSGVDYKQGGPVYKIQWDAQVSSVASVQTLVGLSHTGISLVPVTSGVKNNCGIDVYAQIGARLDPMPDRFGRPRPGEPIDEDYCFETRTSRNSGSYFRRFDDDRIRYTLKSDFSYFIDDLLGVSHTLKGGVIGEKKRYQARDQMRGYSVFEEAEVSFGGIDTILGVGGGLLTRQIAVPGLPDLAEKEAEGLNYGVYFEDQFRPHPNVSLRIGVRADKEEMKADGFKHFDPAAESRAYQESYDACIPPRGRGTLDACARANWHHFHKYEQYPVIGNAHFKEVIQDPRSRLKDREPERFRISNTNLAPRLSISWDPGSGGKTKFFGTAGRYYGETFLAVPLYEQPPDTFLFTYTVVANETTQQCRPDPSGDGTICIIRPEIQSDNEAKIAPATIRQVDRALRTPYQDEYTVGFSREIFQETSITFTAIKRSYRDQFQDIDINHYAQDKGRNGAPCYLNAQTGAMEPGLIPADRVPDGLFDDCVGRIAPVLGPPPFYRLRLAELPDGIPDLFVHNPFFNQVNAVGNFNESDYKAYQLELKRRLHRNWELEASYVWSKATGNAEDYAQILGDDPTTVQDEFGFLSYDQRHFVKVNARTQVPAWNVRLSTSFSWESGLPFSIVEKRTSFDGVRRFGNSAIFYQQLRTYFPTHQRNDQRNTARWNFNIGARKDFTLGKTNLECAVDVINLLNDDSLVIEEVVNGQVVAFRQTGRQFQVGAKLTF